MTKRVAIIGSGCTGLAAIKCCLDEEMAPTCFESSSDIGGLWRFTDDVTDGRGCVMSSTIINTSKEMMSFSDFPPPREFPNLMHHTKVLEYFRMYANKFKLLKHIQFNTEVLSIKQSNATQAKGLWKGNSIVNRIDAIQSDEGVRETSTSNHSSDIITNGLVSNSCNNNNNQNSSNNNNNAECEGGLEKLSHQTENTSGAKASCKTTSSDDACLDYLARENRKPGSLWEVTVKDKKSEETSVHHFDCVLICTGHHADISMPYFPGQSIFKGRIVHSRDLRRASELPGSRQVVVGIGNSGCDAAVELSRHGKVYLSTRRGTWLMQRLQNGGLPADIAFMNRFVFGTALSLPTWMLNKLAEMDLNRKVDHSLYGLRPKHGPFSTHPTVNDELPNRIASGHVVIKPNIDSFTATGVKFDDGTVEDGIDTVVMATGYKIGFPFLDQSVLKVEGNHTPLYLYMFPPSEAPPTLAVIGCIQPGGAVGPVSEMQCRLAARVFKGQAKLPAQSEMEQDIQAKRRAMEKRYIHTPRHTIQVDYVAYMDELAAKIGCKPDLGSLLIKDPRLALTCIFGPCTPYQYRLHGPGAWEGARQAIMTQMERVKAPFSTRRIGNPTGKTKYATDSIIVNVSLITLLVLSACIFLSFIL